MVCLQETHFIPQSTPKYFSRKYPQVYTASANTKQRGVLIAFHRATPFTLTKELKDPEGRYLILSGFLLDSEVTIVSYYAPNKNPLLFLSHLFSVIDSHKQGTLIIGGDSNQTIYPFLDKSPTPHTTPKLSYQRLLNQHSLLDTWREHNPARRQYTHYSHPHKQFSRIDHLFVPVSTSAFILNSNITPCTWSDHNPVITTLSSLVPKPNHKTWCINDRLLANSTFR